MEKNREKLEKAVKTIEELEGCRNNFLSKSSSYKKYNLF